MSDGAALLVAVLLLAANAFFVAAEFALISARRTAIEQRGRGRAVLPNRRNDQQSRAVLPNRRNDQQSRAVLPNRRNDQQSRAVPPNRRNDQQSRTVRITLRAMERVSLMLAGAQLGITICSLGLGALGEPAVAHLLDPVFGAVGLPDSVRHPVAFALALAVVVFLHVVVGEMVPKNLTLAGPDRAALLLGPPLAGLVVVLKPVIVVLNALANLGLRTLRVEPKDEVASAFTREEVAGLLAQSRREGLLEPGRERLLFEALAFDERTVAGVLVPVRSVVTVPASVTPAEVEALVARTGYSRFPVVLDADMTGYVHIKDLLGVPDRDRPVDPALVRALPAVGADSSLRAALQQMQTTGAHLIRVLVDDGRLIGVVMLEDALEELVGEVTDAGRRP